MRARPDEDRAPLSIIMKLPFNWKKTLLAVADVVLGVYIVLAFVAFDKPGYAVKACSYVDIDIQDATTSGFITKDEIVERLKKAGLYPLGKQMQSVDSRRIETMLKQSPFVRTAECYKTEDGQVRITLTQRMPTLHIKAANGDDYYLDDNHSVMPNSHYTSNLIIVTGSCSRWFAQHYIAYLGEAIAASQFWSNQVEQINVLPDQGIELVPRVGDQIIYIGHLPHTRYVNRRPQLINDYVTRKLDRMEKFYKYAMPKAGWNKYSYIDVEFDNQIICKKRTTTQEE